MSGRVAPLAALALLSFPLVTTAADLQPVPKTGARPPESARPLITAVKYYERTAARAIVEKDWRMARDALAAHPLVNSYSLAEGLLNDYLGIYEAYTGGWTK